MLASTSGDPPDYLAAPGEWIWSSVFARDPNQDAGFYKAVFGYDVFDLPSDDGAQHVILSSDDYARAGINTLTRPAIGSPIGSTSSESWTPGSPQPKPWHSAVVCWSSRSWIAMAAKSR